MLDSGDVYFTENHLKMMEYMRQYDGDTQKTADEMDISRQQIYNFLYRIRRIRERAQNTVNVANNWSKNKELRGYLI